MTVLIIIIGMILFLLAMVSIACCIVAGESDDQMDELMNDKGENR